MPISNFWVTGVVLYGTPTGLTHLRAKEVTNDLLNHACDRLQMCKGPAFVGGDVNQDLHYLPAVARLSAMGYVEVQELWFRQTGQLPKPTCRHKTQRDFLWISPQLVAAFVRCEVDHNVWIDHASVRAVFSGQAMDLQTWNWPCPVPLDWSHASPCREVSFVDFAAPNDPTVQYRRLWEQVEAHVSSVYPKSRLLPGRAQCFEPVSVRAPAPHLRRGRGGDLQAPAVPQTWVHFHRFRQARRLQSLVRLLAAPVQLPGHVTHRCDLWQSILSSSGYKPCFNDWWNSEVCNLGIRALPVCVPDLATASLVLQVVLDDCKSVERSMAQRQAYVAKTKRKHDPNHVFGLFAVTHRNKWMF